MVRNCATRPGELIINPQTKPYVDWMRFGVSAFLTEFEFPFLNFRVSLESSAYEPVSESG